MNVTQTCKRVSKECHEATMLVHDTKNKVAAHQEMVNQQLKGFGDRITSLDQTANKQIVDLTTRLAKLEAEVTERAKAMKAPAAPAKK